METINRHGKRGLISRVRPCLFQATRFRIWATSVLRKHLVDGYTINERRLKAAEHKYLEIQQSLNLLRNVIHLGNVSDGAS
ncbi:MAG: virulence RhuM family protein [Candidatus Omnitrophica bacterium]|nr:virulence RhuM family protein [Candidatus Omnitrophota bacterium]